MDQSNPKPAAAWKYALLPTLLVLFLALYPQINIWLVKGSTWNGSYVVSNYDEVAYSAYVNALIEGRPRKSDPFLGCDNVEGESLYSIQFVPAYAIAGVARFLGVSAPAAFVLLNFLIPLFSCLAIFLLLREVTGDKLLAAVGVLVVLCFGAAIAFQGELQHRILQNYLCDFFPFLRRYQPGLAFPVFFVFSLLVFRMLGNTDRRKAIIYSVAAGLLLVILVFSYFFLWTAALAWLACLTLLWFWFRPSERGQTLLGAGIVGVFGIAAIVPYFMMLANRPQNMDETQLLSFTRMPHLVTIPEVIGLLVIAVIAFLIRKRKLQIDAPPVLFTLSLAACPFVLFNQQVVTGRSLQPVHYELFIANYLILLAIVMLGWLIGSAIYGPSAAAKLRRPLVYIAVAAVIWGFVESTATANRNAGYESLRDDAMPALKYIREQQAAGPAADGRYGTVMSSNLMVADYVSTVTPYRSIWSPHTNSAGGVNLKENRELFYQYLYYSGFDENDLATALNEGVFEVKAALFGGGRALSELDKNASPITRAEGDEAIKAYGIYRAAFDKAKAADPELSFVIVPALAEPNFQMLDRWYERDAGNRFGLFVVYQVKLKP